MLFELLQVTTLILSIFNANLVSVSDATFCNDVSSYERSSCVKVGYGDSVQSPFWITTSEKCNGTVPYPGFELKCEDDLPAMNISNHLYYVKDFDSAHLVLIDEDIHGQDCPQPRHNFSLQSQPFLQLFVPNPMTIFYNCTIDPKIGWYEFACLENSYDGKTRHSYAFLQDEIPEGFEVYCEESVAAPADMFDQDFTNTLKAGFTLNWYNPVECDDCMQSGGSQCTSNQTTGGISCQCPGGTTQLNKVCPDGAASSVSLGDATQKSNISDSPANAPLGSNSPGEKVHTGMSTKIKITIGVSIGVGGLLLIVLLYRGTVYTLHNTILSRKNKTDRPANVKAFLEKNYGCLSLQIYKYLDVKRMTNSFKETVGQGGFGTVYKGKLQDGCLVAVKVLNESKGNGEDFINEVASIGRTNHVNVVSLLGFCTDGNKRALVYEFMSNGSLERFIYNNHQSNATSSPPLGWEKLYHIALGVARGLEYLHRGCNTRILHLDIKPHNILLDQNFCPKISDFGLAILCPTLASIVSMDGARGTMGYIAPEVCCRNFGGVSHKSDVYSYGMMVLEMIGGRKNIDVTVVNISEIYFPHWIYNHLEQGNKVHGAEECKNEISRETFEDEKAKKMIIVALWCIQAHPNDRPSMRKVAEMLEGNVEELQMPPNPNMDPQSKYSSSP